jgi:hypothetical protein
MSILDELDDPTSEVLDPTEVFGDGPAWVTKLGIELMTMLTPRLQMRVGDRATPEKVGALVGSSLTLMKGATTTVERPEAQEALKLFRDLLGGFDVLEAAKRLPQRRERFRVAFVRSIGRILERPNEEQYGFFHAIARAMRPCKRSTHGALTASEKRQLNTIAVYGVTLMNWRAIDKLKSSKQAYDFLCKLLSVEIVGHDPERIRRMFGRLGKQFKTPGRPCCEKTRQRLHCRGAVATAKPR